jgi:hypothetical protein
MPNRSAHQPKIDRSGAASSHAGMWAGSRIQANAVDDPTSYMFKMPDDVENQTRQPAPRSWSTSPRARYFSDDHGARGGETPVDTESIHRTVKSACVAGGAPRCSSAGITPGRSAGPANTIRTFFSASRIHRSWVPCSRAARANAVRIASMNPDASASDRTSQRRASGRIPRRVYFTIEQPQSTLRSCAQRGARFYLQKEMEKST